MQLLRCFDCFVFLLKCSNCRYVVLLCSCYGVLSVAMWCCYAVAKVF